MKKDLTLDDLQKQLPWTIKYSRHFKANPQGHKDFAHALIHTLKAAGKLAGIVDDIDHRMDSTDFSGHENYVADLVLCALRMANTSPSPFNLHDAVIKRIETKNGVVLRVIEKSNGIISPEASEEQLGYLASKLFLDRTKPNDLALGWRKCYGWVCDQLGVPLSRQIPKGGYQPTKDYTSPIPPSDGGTVDSKEEVKPHLFTESGYVEVSDEVATYIKKLNSAHEKTSKERDELSLKVMELEKKINHG